MHINLPKENWAELRDPDEVSERSRRPIMSAINSISKEGWKALQQLNPDEVKAAVADDELDAETAAKVGALSAADLEALQAANDACIVALVREWSYPQAITLDGALDLPSAAYDRLRDECSPAIKTLFVSFEPNLDPKEPARTTNSGESNGHSKADLSIIDPFPSSSEPISSSSSGSL